MMKGPPANHFSVALAGCGVVSIAWLSGIFAADPDQAVELSRQYLESVDPGKKAALAEKLAPLAADWQQVLDQLRTSRHEAVKPGYYREEHFSDPALRKRHPEDLLYLVVPSSYQPATATGLVVFMHGGGKGSARTAPDRYMAPADKDTPVGSTRLGEIFEATGMIGVGPSAPWNENNHSRWTMPESDEYLADVILECKRRYHIDPDRVFLMGHSMGGFGAYHQVQRQPDRFAAVIASAGSWTLAQWPVIRGTTFCIAHGMNDAEHGVRDRHTDFAFARFAHEMLAERDIPHVLLQQPGGHSVGYSKALILKFLQDNQDLRRDAFFPHIAIASPVGYRESTLYPLHHNRWLTLDAATEGKLEFDALKSNGKGHRKDGTLEEWNSWRLTRSKVEHRGAMVEAINKGDNLIEVTTSNVARFTVWLHPRMVDFCQAVRVTVNGEPRFEGKVEPSLGTALESFERRRDWGLVYPAKITLDLKP